MARLRLTTGVPDRFAGVPRQALAARTAPLPEQYTDPSRDPTTISPAGPIAGDESMGPSVAKDQTSVPSGDTA